MLIPPRTTHATENFLVSYTVWREEEDESSSESEIDGQDFEEFLSEAVANGDMITPDGRLESSRGGAVWSGPHE